MAKSRLITGIVGISSIRILSLPLGIMTSVALVRMLGAEDYGKYAFAISLATLVSLPIGQGVTELLTREIAQGLKQKKYGVHNGILQWAYLRLAAYSVCLSLVATVFWLILDLNLQVLIAVTVLAPMIAAYQIYGGAMRGHSASVFSQIPEFLFRPLGVLVLITLFWWMFTTTLFTALAGHIIATGMGVALSWLMLHRLTPSCVSTAKPLSHTCAWRRSSYSFILISANNFMVIEIGVILLGLLGQPEQVAGMRIAQSGAQLVNIALVAGSVQTLPRLAILAQQAGGEMSLKKTYIKAARIALLGALGFGIPIILLSETLIKLAFGEEFIDLVKGPLIILCLMQIFHASFGSSSALLNMSGLEKQNLIAQITALTTTILGALLLSPVYGATGAAIAIFGGMISKKIIEAFFVRQHYGIWLHAMSRV